MKMKPLTLDKIYHAAFTMKGVVRTTDLIHAPDLLEGSEIYLKTENLQVTGSFKVRGAYYKISQLSPEERAHRLLRGQPRAGSGSCRNPCRTDLDHLHSGWRTDLKGGGHQALRRTGRAGQGRL